MEAADPEQRLTLAAHIAELAIQLRRPLEQRQFARVLGQPLLFLVELRKKPGVNDPATSQGLYGPTGASSPVQAIVQDVVPLGATDIERGEPVHALDGEIGRVHGCQVDPDDHRVTHVLLGEGHLWGRKEVAIPASAVTKVENGIWLNLTKKQVEDLPPVG
jgi:sporulation protein YlmC with PRC-barrel domain